MKGVVLHLSGECVFHWRNHLIGDAIMSVLETCKRAGRSGLEFVSQTLRAFANPLLPHPILLTPR
jgi:hypothetical protein